MRLIYALVAIAWSATASAETTYIGSYLWASDNPQFGGISAMSLSEDGMELVAVSDRSFFVTGNITRADGIITAVENAQITRMSDTGTQGDSEGIAIAKNGAIFVSFEGVHGVRQFDGVDGTSTPLPTAEAFAGMQNNSSLEALAIGPDGALYTIPERSGRATRPFPIYRFKDGIWDQSFTIPRRGAFLVVGADIGPDGNLYILERDFTGFGFRSRVRRFDLSGQNEEPILETAPLIHDNLEGISVWDDGIGMRITMVSDDNFRLFQRTEIVEYRISD
ncbi:esterase-like activity of phytase family protein [Loktanella sp. D2R18]|uniref:esterase-like activity of phytase family protein n=1 Tax=Rhodobacterales TaxID=204455 RepID=UPI000DEAF436|nr:MULTISPECIES: esterase-like activity of phytase family protein [Rhodobacterales]MDO6591447.1 esterase-like activity of phytase family protein [Yoonia sp. 1_MG-2023]RBW43488.1 esterase-like activity of phytase family protein [Loktanella sp. D2R18]